MRDTLYLLKPGFKNAGLGPLYCGDSVSIEGMLSFFPELRDHVEVRYLDFPRPRSELVERLGESNQTIPVLILAEGGEIQDGGVAPKVANGVRFLDDERVIRRYLSAQHALPQAG